MKDHPQEQTNGYICGCISVLSGLFVTARMECAIITALGDSAMAAEGPSDLGTMVKQRRLAARLTQEALAERAGISARAIADLERGIIRAPRRDTLELLADALDLEQAEREAWQKRRQELSLPPTATHRTHTLPSQVNTIIGREQEIQALKDLISTPGTRLVTITGPGGVGKTRIALAAGQQLTDLFPDGVQFLELASVRLPELLISTVARQLGMRDGDVEVVRERLTRYLSQRQMLLILDNAEHLRSAAADLASLLTSSEQLQMLVTSRAGLRITAEVEFPVHPLALPGREVEPSAEAIAAYPAIQLFVQRAKQVRPDFELTDDNSEAVSRICAYLDGLPLAIELAAARVKVLPPSRIVPRLIDRLGFLTDGMLDAPDRHQTMRAAIDWSYNLLGPIEKHFFRRLSTFVGGFTLEGAEAVAPEDIDPVDGLTRLMNDNLISQAGETREDVRFTMLDTVREFGLEQLKREGERELVRNLHAEHYLRFVEASVPEIRGAGEPDWLRRMETDLANLRAALEWMHRPEGNPVSALRMVAGLTWFWQARGYVSEGRVWLHRALEYDSPAAELHMKVLTGAGWFAHIQQDSEEAERYLQQALRLARGLDERWWESWVQHLIGRVAYFDGDPSTAEEHAAESLRIAKELGDRWLEAWAEHLFGLAAFIREDLTASKRHHERSLEIRKAIGYTEGISLNTGLIGVVLLREGDSEAAYELFRTSLRTGQEIGARWLIINWISNIVRIAAESGQTETAARLVGFVDSMSGLTGAYPIPISQSTLQIGIKIAREQLGEDQFEQHAGKGKRLSMDEAIAEASGLFE
jgi:predicted ATPase/DNA-binding XRE family transcriptional regulator